MTRERLQKVLAAAGIASRRASEELIAEGRVTIDGRPATLGESVDPDESTIEVDGRPIRRVTTQIYLAVHKPAGVTSTMSDPHAERTILELVPRELRPVGGRLFPVGRLDQDSEGLILLTSDGDWANRVLHPRYGVEREYAVGLSLPLDTRQFHLLGRGIALDEGVAHLVHLRAATSPETRRLSHLVEPPLPPLTWYRATLRQGWKRQLRRMFAAVGAPVERLVRVRIGTVRLDGLRSGQARALTPAEVRSLASSRAGVASAR